MSKTVVGLFNSTAEAQQVKQALVSNGYDASSIRVVANDSADDLSSTEDIGTSYGTTSASSYESGNAERSDTRSTATGVGEKIGNFFRSLTGSDNEAHSHYTGGVSQGGAVLTVTADDNDANEVASLLRQHGARDIEGGYGSSTAGTSTGAYADPLTSSTNYGDRSATSGNMTGETAAIPIVEEELVVGKREVDRGGVRIYSHVVERPVDADVTLRDERIDVERRAVNRPATEADFASGSAAVELRATGEEAVVGKSSRVVEEVLVGKQSTQHTEAIHDTVRKTEVEVEDIPEQTRETTTGVGSTVGSTKDRF